MPGTGGAGRCRPPCWEAHIQAGQEGACFQGEVLTPMHLLGALTPRLMTECESWTQRRGRRSRRARRAFREPVHGEHSEGGLHDPLQPCPPSYLPFCSRTSPDRRSRHREMTGPLCRRLTKAPFGSWLRGWFWSLCSGTSWADIIF